ncbi:TadE/TadG family type IV pilus assembly protein [Nocardiopsis sp. MG754419]|uniref:TadE/TadG family type IV pilus assembly protein n=1 Tax=Nocardiopsis sp. MG754419 TaxID=2259865 RepID=UPI0027DD55F5|nr:TadE/TadG family type IV pilus assembly protein [Nocardiopsis sp. MG754419]MBR8743775.1 pilus assembly protein [Nocardiopsis sp. MG754419]
MSPERADRGSASVELVLLTPVLLALALLMVLAGRVVDAGSTADGVAHSAARAASMERTAGAAEAAAAATAASSLAENGLVCGDHTVVLEHGGLVPGGAVTARVECRVGLDGLTGLGVPGSYTASGSATVVVDTFRGQP